VTITIACVIIDDACYTIFKPTVTTPVKVRKPYLEIRILIHRCVVGEREGIFFII
jgi:hypothetical protein